MVKLLEYQGKELLSRYGITVPKSIIIKNETSIPEFKTTSFLKAQVPVGHRGERGGVVKVNNKAEVEKAIQNISKLKFDGYTADSFLLEEEVPHDLEFYVSISLDRSTRLPVLLISKKGGVDIEKIEDSEIYRYSINPLMGIPDYFSRLISRQLSLPDILTISLLQLLNSLFNIYKKEDAELVEINPLVLNSMKNGLIALDSKVVIEDDAMFRHKEITDYTSRWLDPLELEAKQKGISFVRLGGKIGVIANGAGLTMATLDILKNNNADAGDFLDLGGTDDPEKITQAFELINKTNPSALFVNIFGGVTKCDVVADGLIKAISEFKPKFNIVVRLKGFREKEATEILKSNGINSFSDMEEAVKKVIELAGVK